MKNNNVILPIVVVFTFLFYACLGTTEPREEPNIFSLTITLLDAGQQYEVGDDTLMIITHKMIIDSLSVIKQGEEDERYEPRPLVAFYTHGYAEYNSIGGGELSDGKFDGIGYSVVTPSAENIHFDDPDLIERDEGTGEITNIYSIAVIGLYNNKVFRFRSQVSRPVQYGFYETIEMPEFSGFLEARLRGNWKQWFLNTNGDGLLNPNDPANKQHIEENILKYFDIETITVEDFIR